MCEYVDAARHAHAAKCYTQASASTLRLVVADRASDALRSATDSPLDVFFHVDERLLHSGVTVFQRGGQHKPQTERARLRSDNLLRPDRIHRGVHDQLAGLP